MKGVMVDNVQHNAAIVVSNMDVYFTYRNLLNDFTKAAIVKNKKEVVVLSFFIGG